MAVFRDPPEPPDASADGELLEVSMLQCRRDVAVAVAELAVAVHDLMRLRADHIDDIEAFDRFQAVKWAATTVAEHALDGARYWHRSFHGPESDL